MRPPPSIRSPRSVADRHRRAAPLAAGLLIGVLAAGCGSLARATEVAPTPGPSSSSPARPWPVATPEAEGLSSAALAALVDAGRERGMDGLLVARHGRIVAEAYYAPYRSGLLHNVHSATKAVLGLLVGIAAEQGALGPLDQPAVAALGNGARPAGPDDRQRAITLEHLLDMTSGIEWQEPLAGGPVPSLLAMERSPDWLGFVLARPMAHAPGTVFGYSSGNSHLLSAVLAAKTGRPASEFARSELFEPLGIATTRWPRDRQGIAFGGFGLALELRDMARIGQLVLQRGAWQGRQLVPAAWIERIFGASVDMGFGDSPAFRYASGWWVLPGRRVALAAGFNRQLIVVWPELDLVVATTGRRNYPLVPFLDAVAAAVRAPGSAPADAAAHAQLTEAVQKASIETPSAVREAPALASRISGRAYQFDRNPLGMRALTLDLRPGSARYDMLLEPAAAGTPPRRVTGPLGLDGLFRVDEPTASVSLATKGTWRDDQTFVVVSRSLQDGVVSVYTLTYGDSSLDVLFENNRGAQLRFSGRSAD